MAVWYPCRWTPRPRSPRPGEDSDGDAGTALGVDCSWEQRRRGLVQVVLVLFRWDIETGLYGLRRNLST